MFLTPVDIANRSLQHCGSTRIDPTLGFAEDSKQASEIGFCYDKLRLAELRRNVWVFAIKLAALRAIDADTMLLTPGLWASGTTYFFGSIVADENGQLWISNIPNNLGNQPENTTAWDEYFGPMTVMLYDSTTTYSAGELVYTTAGDGTSRVFISLENANADNPATATAWSATVTYEKNQVITYLTVIYMSQIDLNLNQVPGTSPTTWSALTSYNIGNTVLGSDSIIYSSLGSGNTNHNPVTDGGLHWLTIGPAPWTISFIGGAGSIKWRQIGGAEFPMGVGVVPLNFIYPIGSGPSTQTSSRNVFRLPANWLREAPQDPKAGSTSALGAPTNRLYNDWLYQGDYIVSMQVDPIIYRFVADTVDVRRFDAMFCEGLACRIGYEVCEILTQSSTKKADIAKAYDEFMGWARTVNAIQAGSEEPPLDDYLAVRF